MHAWQMLLLANGSDNRVIVGRVGGRAYMYKIRTPAVKPKLKVKMQSVSDGDVLNRLLVQVYECTIDQELA